MYPEYQIYREQLAERILTRGGISYLGVILNAIERAHDIDPASSPSVKIYQNDPGLVYIDLGNGFSYDWMRSMVGSLGLDLVNVPRKGWVCAEFMNNATELANNILIEEVSECIYPSIHNYQWMYMGSYASLVLDMKIFGAGHHDHVAPHLAFYSDSQQDIQDVQVAVFDSEHQKNIFYYVMSTYGYLDDVVLNNFLHTSRLSRKEYIRNLNSQTVYPWLVPTEGRAGMKVPGINDPRPQIIYNWLGQNLRRRGMDLEDIPANMQTMDLYGSGRLMQRVCVDTIETERLFDFFGNWPIKVSSFRPWIMLIQNPVTKLDFLLEVNAQDVQVVNLFENNFAIDLNNVCPGHKTKDFVRLRFKKFVNRLKAAGIRLAPGSGAISSNVMVFPIPQSYED